MLCKIKYQNLIWRKPLFKWLVGTLLSVSTNYNHYSSGLATAESLAGLCGDDGYQSVKNIEYNDDFSEITIAVDKENYENGYDRFVKIAAGLCCRMDQVFDVDAAQKVSIKVKDNVSGDIIETAVYPEENG